MFDASRRKRDKGDEEVLCTDFVDGEEGQAREIINDLIASICFFVCTIIA